MCLSSFDPAVSRPQLLQSFLLYLQFMAVNCLDGALHLPDCINCISFSSNIMLWWWGWVGGVGGARTFHLCAVTPCRLVGNQCPAHLLYGLWLSHSHVLGERSSLGDGGHFAEPYPPPLHPPPTHTPPPLLLVLVEGKMTICCPSCPVTGQQPSLMAQFHCPLSALDFKVCVYVCVCMCREASALHLTCIRGDCVHGPDVCVSSFVLICHCVRLRAGSSRVSASRRAKYCEQLPVGDPERTHPE